MIKTITPKILILLFRKLKSQTILYNLDVLPNSNDRTTGKSYCVGYRINSAYRLIFRRTDDGGWSSSTSKNYIIFDTKENVKNNDGHYWNVRITPEIAQELLQQRREHK